MLYYLQLKYSSILNSKNYNLGFNNFIFYKYCKDSRTLQILFCTAEQNKTRFVFYLKYFLLQQIYNYCFVYNSEKTGKTLYNIIKEKIKKILIKIFNEFKNVENLKINFIGNELTTVFIQYLTGLLPEILKNNTNITQICFDLINVYGVCIKDLIVCEHVLYFFAKEKKITLNILIIFFLNKKLLYLKTNLVLGFLFEFDKYTNYTILTNKNYFFKKVYKYIFYTNNQKEYFYKIFKKSYKSKKRSAFFLKILFLPTNLYIKTLQRLILNFCCNFYTGFFCCFLFLSIFFLNLYIVYIAIKKAYFYLLLTHNKLLQLFFKLNKIANIIKRFV